MNTAIIAGVVSLIVNLIVYVFNEQINRLLLTLFLNVKDSTPHENYIRLRVANNFYGTIKKARLYITLKHTEDDVIEPHKDTAFIKPSTYSELKEARLCWSFRTFEKNNPTELDIFAKEKPDTNLCQVQADKIIIPSEEGWQGTKRIILKIRKYSGELKIVSENTNAKTYKIEIIPESMSCLIY